MANVRATRNEIDAFVVLLKARTGLVNKMSRLVKLRGAISMEFYDILLILEDAPSQRMQMSEIGAASMLSPSGATRLIDRMEKDGLVRRECNDHDRRSTFAVLTPKGQNARKDSEQVHLEVLHEVWGSKLNNAECRSLIEILKRFEQLSG